MRRNRFTLLLLAALIATLFVAPQLTLAQSTATCQQLVEDAIEAIGTNCANNETGFACLASPEISSVFVEGFDETLFDEPGERISLADLIRVSMEPSSRVDETWGITVYNLQASLPSGFPSDVVALAFGGSELEAGVSDEVLFEALAEPVSATTMAASELRIATMTPPADAEVDGSAPAGSSVLVDAVSGDGDWVRGIFADRPVWFQSSAFAAADVADLPVLEAGRMTPYQRFYSATGVAGDCNEAVSLVLMQGPSAIPVDVMPNGIPIRIESTVLIRTFEGGVPVGRTMEIIVLFGVVTINPDSDNPIYVPAGYRVLIGFGPDFTSLGNEGDDDERTGPITVGQPTILSQTELDGFRFLSIIPSNIINYIIQLPQIITASGVGGPLPQIIFNNPNALAVIERFCERNLLPDPICAVFGF